MAKNTNRLKTAANMKDRPQQDNGNKRAMKEAEKMQETEKRKA